MASAALRYAHYGGLFACACWRKHACRLILQPFWGFLLLDSSTRQWTSFVVCHESVGGVGEDGVVVRERVAAGTIDLSALCARWDLLAQLAAVLDDTLLGRSDTVLHPRMIDEGQTAGHRVYMAAERYLGIAAENHDALRTLLLGEFGLTPSVPWNLLRPTFESAFYVIWLLDPDESIVRRRRGLWLEWLDELEHRLYYKDAIRIAADGDAQQFADVTAQLAAREARNEAIFRQEALEVGLAFPPPRTVNVLKALGALSCARSMMHGDVLLRSTWRVLSGMQHGRASTMLRSSDATNERPSRGGIHVMLAVNDDAFLNAAHVTTNLHMEATRLLIERSRDS